MGILRLGMIVAVGVALLPSDREQQEILYNRAALAAKWTVTFCDRNAQTCATASSLWDQFAKKAQFGAKLAYDTLAEHLGGGERSFDAQPSATLFGGDGRPRVLETGALKSARASSGTLQPGDLEHGWRGEARKPVRALNWFQPHSTGRRIAAMGPGPGPCSTGVLAPMS